MKRIKVIEKKNGFNGHYYISNKNSKVAFIAFLSKENEFSKGIAKYVKQFGANVIGLYPLDKEKKFLTLHYQLERFEKAIAYLKERGIEKIGLITASSYSPVGLKAASLFNDITCVLAFTPSNYIIEGTYISKKGKIKEFPSGRSVCSYKDQDLSFHPFSLSKEEYWNIVKKDEKKYKEPHTLEAYVHSLKESPLKEDELIEIENINGPILLAGASDDTMWNSVDSINNMASRLKEKNFKFEVKVFTYQYGTHFILPQPIFKYLKNIGGEFIIKKFQSGKKYSKECKESRINLDKEIIEFVDKWINAK